VNQEKPNEVIVTDFDVSFLSLVRIMIKMAFAAIPAILVIYFIFALLFGGLLGIG
jgi:hypothetical protein